MNLFGKHKTLENLLPGFLLEREIQCKVGNSQAYRHHCGMFIQWLKDERLFNLPLRKIDDKIVARFFMHIAIDTKLDRPTCEKYFLHIRLLFKYAEKLGEIQVVPFNDVVFPKKGIDKSAEVIHSEHLKPFLEEIRKNDPQLFLACMIEYYCFIRPGRELRLLKIGDIDLVQGTITVIQQHAKNNQRQVVTMPVHLINICKEYGVDQADKNLYVFGNKKKFGTKPVSVNHAEIQI